MKGAMSAVGKKREKRSMISPSLPMRNFSKFQAMSDRATGDHSVTVVESKAPVS